MKLSKFIDSFLQYVPHTAARDPVKIQILPGLCAEPAVRYLYDLAPSFPPLMSVSSGPSALSIPFTFSWPY